MIKYADTDASIVFFCKLITLQVYAIPFLVNLCAPYLLNRYFVGFT